MEDEWHGSQSLSDIGTKHRRNYIGKHLASVVSGKQDIRSTRYSRIAASR